MPIMLKNNPKSSFADFLIADKDCTRKKLPMNEEVS